MTKVMFKKMAKCDANYFKVNAPKILNKELSLKCVIDSSGKDLEVKKTCSQITALTNYQSIEQLEVKFPGKFSEAIVEKFVGSEV